MKASFCLAATLVASSVLFASQTPPPAREIGAKVTQASLFKNGLAVTVREIPVAQIGDIVVKDMPAASLGTLWFATTEGLALDSVVATTRPRSNTRPVANLNEALTANVGKDVVVGIQPPGGTSSAVPGRLLAATGDVIVLDVGATVQIVPKSQIVSLNGADGTLVYQLTSEGEENIVRLGLSGRAGPNAKVYMLALERGATWVPAYQVNLLDDEILSLTLRATVMNDLAPFDKVEVRLITGFPNLPFAGVLEPLTSGQAVDQFTSLLAGSGVELQRARRGPGGQMMLNQAPAAMDAARFGDASAMPVAPQLPGEQAEDLFFYRLPNVTMKVRDRGYFVLFRAQADYREIYTWDLDDLVVNNVDIRPGPPVAEPEEVWHTVEFDNPAGVPLTTGTVTTMRDDKILGQDMMRYTSRGGRARVRITQALDIRAEANEEEVSRERGAIKDRFNNPVFDLVTLKGTLLVRNNKPEIVAMRITKPLTGEIVSTTGNPKITKTTRGLRDTNPAARISWEPNVPAGGEITLEYTYKLYVRAQ